MSEEIIIEDNDWPIGESNSSPSSSSIESIPSPSFSSNELTKAISELGWGLLAWEILLHSTDSTSTLMDEDEDEQGQDEEEVEEVETYSSCARLELLEQGSIITIKVSYKGWKIISVDGLVNSTNLNAQTLQGKDYETLDSLLSNVSPMFESRRLKLLIESLENISVRRDWEEVQEGEEEGEIRVEE